MTALLQYASERNWRKQVAAGLDALEPVAYAVADLPPAGIARVTDGAAALAWGDVIAGGGAASYLVWFNGADWTVVGK